MNLEPVIASMLYAYQTFKSFASGELVQIVNQEVGGQKSAVRGFFRDGSCATHGAA